jgi:hypothetical protein
MGKMTSTERAGEEFLQRLGDLYGNPNAKFHNGGKLKAQQPLKVLVGDQYLDAFSLGRNFQKNTHAGKGHWVQCVDDNGRKWNLRLNANQILVEW